jgi:hypothetical protein
MTYLIPLTNIPQTFEIQLNGITYNLTTRFNDQDDAGWVIDLADADNVPLVTGLPLVTGGNLLDGLEYLGIGGELWVYTNGDPNAVPTVDNLGTDSNLYFVSNV